MTGTTVVKISSTTTEMQEQQDTAAVVATTDTTPTTTHIAETVNTRHHSRPIDPSRFVDPFNVFVSLRTC